MENKPKLEDFIASQQFNLTSFNHILMEYREDKQRGGFAYKTICNQRLCEHFVTYEQAQIAIDYEKSSGWNPKTNKYEEVSNGNV